MSILGAPPGDLLKCIWSKDQDACERVYIGYYLWPRIQVLLEELELLQPIRPPVQFPPQPDPSPWLLPEIVSVLLAPQLGEPNLQPSLPAEFRLQTTIKFRDGLKGVVRELDKEIEELKQFSNPKS